MARISAIVAARARAAAGAAPSAAATAAATAADATVATAAAAAAAAAVAAAAAATAAAAVPWPANGSIAAVGASRLLRRTWLCRWRCHGIPRQIRGWQNMCYLLFGIASAHQTQVFACCKYVKRILKLSKTSCHLNMPCKSIRNAAKRSIIAKWSNGEYVFSMCLRTKKNQKSPSLGLPQLLLQLLLAVALCTLVLTLPPLACAGFFAAFDFAHAFAVVLSCEMIDNTRFIMFGPACDH